MRRDPRYVLDPEPYDVGLVQILAAIAIWGVVGVCLLAQHVWAKRKDLAKIVGKSLLVAVFLFDIWAGLMLQATGGAR